MRAGDLVGAIAGETGIAGGQIGKIEIRAQFSLVEIDSQVVDQVIRKLNGATIRGLHLRCAPRVKARCGHGSRHFAARLGDLPLPAPRADRMVQKLLERVVPDIDLTQ